MRRRPSIIILLAVGHFFAPIFNFIIQAYWANTPLLYYIELFFQPENFSRHWFNLFAPMVGGILILIFRKWSYYLYIMVMFALAFVSYARFLEKPHSVGLGPILLAYATNLVIVVYFLRPKVRSVYFDPRLRWWESAPRYAMDIPCRFGPQQPELSGVISNFSRTGLFVKAEKFPDDNEILKVNFDFQGDVFDFQGQVVHHNRLNMDGFGIKFLLNPKSKKAARKLSDRLMLRDREQRVEATR